MKKFNLISRLLSCSHEKQKMGGMRRYAAMLLMLLTIGVGQMWGSKGFFDDGQWNVQYYYTGNSNTWMAGDYKNGSTQNLGIMTTFYLKGCWVKTWGDENVYNVKFMYGYTDHSESGNYTKYYDDGDHSKGYKGDYTWTFDNLIDFNVIGNAPNSVGANTLWVRWSLDGDAVTSGTSYINFTIPGFTTTSTSQAFDNTFIDGTNSKTISFGQHYGTALTTGNCAITGTNASDFSVTSISETGVTVQFYPRAAGSKSATLTITDAHSKTCTITLTGKTKYLVTYSKGNNGSGENRTTYKVHGESLTLASSGYFSRTGYHQTAWNTNAAGSGGTSYSLGGSYTSNAAVTLYPTWTANSYSVKFNGNGSTGGSMSNQGFTYDAAQNLTSNAFTKTGYTFAGWATSADGNVVYTDGQSVSNLTSTNSGTYNLYAKWTPVTYTISFDANGGAKSADGTKSATYESTTSLASCPTGIKDGYCFDGWATAASDGDKVINSNGSFVANVTNWTDGSGRWKKASDATVYAIYTAPTTLVEQPARVGGQRVAIDTLDAKNYPNKDTVIVHQLISPTATGNYNITYKLCYENHVQLDRQPTIKYGTGVKAGYDTIKMPMDEIQRYELVAYLCTGTTRGSGDTVTTDTAIISVEKTYPVKVRYIVDGKELRTATEWPTYPSLRTTEVRVPKERNGYILDHLDYGIGITSDSTKDITYFGTEMYATYVKAANAATITAHYKVAPNTVYFFQTGESWYTPYIFDYVGTDYWGTDSNAGKGAGGENKTRTRATRIDFVDNMYMMPITGETTKFAITDDEQENANGTYFQYFYDRTYHSDALDKDVTHTPKVIYRTDFNAALSMFVPVATSESDYYVMNTKAKYYRGFWVKYSPDRDSTGYYLRVYDGKGDVAEIQSIPMRLTQTGAGGTWELTATMDLEGGKTYGFKVTKATGVGTVAWYGNNNTMTSANHTDWDFSTGTSNCGLTTTSAGDYTFHFHCVNFGSKNANNASADDVQGKMVMTVDYATNNGDFRVVYVDDRQTNLTEGKRNVEPIASQTIHARANGKDTVTFFIRKDATNRSMKFQKFTDGAWADVAGVAGTIGLTNTLDQPFTVSKDTTYQIYLEQNADGTAISATRMEYYTGSYYIRTNCVDEHKWDYKQTLEAHRMIESEYASHLTNDPFTHYFVQWVDKGGNVKFVVATKYSPCLTDTLITDAYATTAGGYLPSGDKMGANVRFMYNKGSNWIKRAYLHGSKEGDDNYLILTETSTDKMKDEAGAGLITSITFIDQGNWTYSAEIQAYPGLTGKLTADYNSQTQYFRGTAETAETILGGTGGWQNISMTYDFKTNRLISAWRPNGEEIEGTMEINADVMIIRRGQRDTEQIIFKTDASKLSEVKYIYGVIRLDYNDLVGMMPRWDYWSYAHCMYYISFPFDVLVSDITGVGTIGQDWRIQRYNGAKRAQTGWFSGDGTTTFWEDVQAGDTLHAYEGYSLLLNRTRFNDAENKIWANKTAGSSVYLFFPSLKATVGIVNNQTVEIDVPSHLCTIDRTFINQYGTEVNHKNTDSHWNMMGTPLFEDQTAFSIADNHIDPENLSSENIKYIYAWNSAGNTLGIQLALSTSWKFKTMYSYMVQYAGKVVFKGSAVAPSVAARRAEVLQKYYVNLELSKDEEFVGRTYVELRENAVDTFMLNEDIYMLKNGVNADLYTLAGGYEVGANVMSVGNHTIPVGIDVKTAGTYTFSMPDNFDGTVTLIDTYAQTRTNLSMDDYEIALPKGVISDRFLLEIDINKAPTAIDGVEDGEGTLRDGNAHKYIENGQMYILQNGVIYDARGNRVQ